MVKGNATMEKIWHFGCSEQTKIRYGFWIVIFRDSARCAEIVNKRSLYSSIFFGRQLFVFVSFILIFDHFCIDLFICFENEERKRQLIWSSFVLIFRPKIYGEKLTFVSATIPFIRLFFFYVFFYLSFFSTSLTLYSNTGVHCEKCNKCLLYSYFFFTAQCMNMVFFHREYNDQQTEQSWCVSGTNLNLFRLVDGIDFQFKPIFQVHAWILNAYRHLRNTMPSRWSLQNPFFAPIYAPAPFETTYNRIIRWNEILTQNSFLQHPQWMRSSLDVLTYRKLSMQTVIAIGFGLFNCIIILSECKPRNRIHQSWA